MLHSRLNNVKKTLFTNEGFPYSMLHSRDDLVHGFSDESADDELENLLRKKLNKSKYQGETIL